MIDVTRYQPFILLSQYGSINAKDYIHAPPCQATV